MVHTVIWPASQCSPSFTTALPGEVVVGLRGPFWLVINQGSASDFGRRLEVLRFRAHRFASPHGRPIACEWDDTDRIIEAPVLQGVPFDASALWMRALMGRSGWLPQLGGLGPEHMRTGWIVSIQRGGANVFRAPATLGGGRLCNLLAPQASQGPNPLLSRRPGPIRLVPGMVRVLREGPAAGIRLLCLDEDRVSLPEECRAVVAADEPWAGVSQTDKDDIEASSINKISEKETDGLGKENQTGKTKVGMKRLYLGASRFSGRFGSGERSPSWRQWRWP